MRAVKLKEHGGAENLYLDDNVPMPELSSPDHILLRIVATAVNRADILQREGKYAPPEGESDILGLEASGVVDEIGANVKKLKYEISIFSYIMTLLDNVAMETITCYDVFNCLYWPVYIGGCFI